MSAWAETRRFVEPAAWPPLRLRPVKEILPELFRKTLATLSLDRVIPRAVRCRDGLLQVGGETIHLRQYRRVLAVSIGKAAYQMADTMAKIVDPIPLSGVISGSAPLPAPLPGFSCFQGAHPYPDAESLASGEAVIRLLKSATADDLVLYILSGGGSAICEKPLQSGISLEDCREFYRLLVTSGVNIIDVNFVRKHFSAIKGGRLTELAHPARQLTIYVSDAPPGNPSNVASGPTMPDESTVEACYRIVRKHNLMPRLPRPIRRMFEEGTIPETPNRERRSSATARGTASSGPRTPRVRSRRKPANLAGASKLIFRSTTTVRSPEPAIICLAG